jgi:DNA-binding protein H-NS
MTQDCLQTMPTDELWTFREKVAATLAAKLTAEKRMLEKRLRQLDRRFQAERVQEKSGRRPYPIVLPKFRNPDQPSQTWAGRGKQPRWLSARLRSGQRIEDFRIEYAVT